MLFGVKLEKKPDAVLRREVKTRDEGEVTEEEEEDDEVVGPAEVDALATDAFLLEAEADGIEAMMRWVV